MIQRLGRNFLTLVDVHLLNPLGVSWVWSNQLISFETVGKQLLSDSAFIGKLTLSAGHPRPTWWSTVDPNQWHQDLAGNPGDDLPAEAFPFRAATASNGGSVTVPASSNSVPCEEREVMWGTCLKNNRPEILGRWLWCTTAACWFLDFFKTIFGGCRNTWIWPRGRDGGQGDSKMDGGRNSHN